MCIILMKLLLLQTHVRKVILRFLFSLTKLLILLFLHFKNKIYSVILFIEIGGYVSLMITPND